MSKLVRLILIAAFAIFVVGGIIAIILVNRQPKKTTITKTTEKATTTITTKPAPSTPSPVTISPAPAPAPAAKPTVKKTAVTRRVVTTTFFEDEASASASAGVNDDGSTFAFADAN